jgi:methionine-rich copper-binding protein CopC
MFGRRLRSTGAALALLAIGAVTILSDAPTFAHDGIASSDPASGAVLDEPIDSVTIDFGADIGTAVEIGLVGPDGELPTTTTVTSPTEAIARFALLDEHGTYTVNYLATSVVDGHLLGGAISFTYGGSSSDVMSPLVFGIIALVILSIGGWFSWRAHARSRDDSLDSSAVDVV